MATAEVQAMIALVEQLLREEDLSGRIELAIKKLLNVVEALTAAKKSLADEVERLKAQLEKKKNAKTTASPAADASQTPSDHSSEKRRRKRERQKRNQVIDRRSFKGLTIHETKECPVDPALLPPDAVRLEDEIVIVRDIEIKPKNTTFPIKLKRLYPQN